MNNLKVKVLTGGLQAQFENIIQNKSFYNIGMPNTKEEVFGLMQQAYDLATTPSSNKAIESVEDFAKRSFDESPYGKGREDCHNDLVTIIKERINQLNGNRCINENIYTTQVRRAKIDELTTLLSTLNKK